MSILARAAFAVLIGCLALSPVGADSAPPAAPDATDDPPPAGAIARLGTLRLRHECRALAWAPDGKTFASGGFDGRICIWDPASGQELRQCRGPMQNAAEAMTYFPDGKTLASKSNEPKIRVWNAATGQEVFAFPAADVVALAPGPEEGKLLGLGRDNTIFIWDLTTGKKDRSLQLGGDKKPTTLVLSPDGKRVAGWLPSEDVLNVWDVADGKELFHMPTRLKNMASLVFSADGKTLAASGAPPQVMTWDVETGKELRRYEDCGYLKWMKFSPNGKYVAGLGAGRAIHLWALTSGKELRQFEAPASCGPSWWDAFGALAFSPDGKTVAASQGTAIHLWDVETGDELHPFTGHTAGVRSLRFSADGRRILSCGRDQAARLWDVASAKEMASWAQVHGTAYSMVAAPDAKSILAASPGGWVRVEVGALKNEETPLSGGAAPPLGMSLILSADGKTLVGNGGDGTIHVWNADTGKERDRLPIAPIIFGTFAVSPDGKLLAEGGGKGPVRLWDVAAAKELRPFKEWNERPPGEFRDTPSLNFSPDGKTLLRLGIGDLTLYEVATGRDRMQIKLNGVFARGGLAPDGGLTHAVFSPDGEIVAVASSTGTVFLLDAVNEKELTRLAGHTNVVLSFAFSPDGKTLAAGGVDGTVLVWDVKEWTTRARPATADLKPETLPALWESLRDGDGGKAHKAIRALAAAPKVSAAYLKERLFGAEDPGEKRIARTIADLDDDRFEAREKAQKSLENMEAAAIPAVRQALRSNPPAESRKRLQEVLDQHKEVATDTEDVRCIRALEALERSGAPEAMDALRALAKDAPNPLVKREAAAALDRLAPGKTVP